VPRFLRMALNLIRSAERRVGLNVFPPTDVFFRLHRVSKPRPLDAHHIYCPFYGLAWAHTPLISVRCISDYPRCVFLSNFRNLPLPTMFFSLLPRRLSRRPVLPPCRSDRIRFFFKRGVDYGVQGFCFTPVLFFCPVPALNRLSRFQQPCPSRSKAGFPYHSLSILVPPRSKNNTLSAQVFSIPWGYLVSFLGTPSINSGTSPTFPLPSPWCSRAAI